MEHHSATPGPVQMHHLKYIEGYYGRKVYNERILVVNTTSTSDGGTYTCQVTATGGQETGNFTLTVTSKYVLWYY